MRLAAWPLGGQGRARCPWRRGMGHGAPFLPSCLIFRAGDHWDWSLCAGQSRIFLPILQISQLRLSEEKSHTRGPCRGSMECTQPVSQSRLPSIHLLSPTCPQIQPPQERRAELPLRPAVVMTTWGPCPWPGKGLRGP